MRDLFALHAGTPGEPIELVAYRDGAEVARAPITLHRALDLSVQLVDAVNARFPRPPSLTTDETKD